MIEFGQRRIATPWKQRGFFLNPARFGGSVFQGRLSVGATSSATFGGAAIASAAASAEGTSQLILSDDQLGAGAFSAGGESVATFGGAAIASAAASMAGESGLTMSMAAPITVCDAADFDGTNDYMRRGAGLTGAADAKTGILSVWVRLDGGNSADNAILVGATTLGGAGSRFFASRNASNKFDLLVTSSAGALVLWDPLESTCRHASLSIL